MKNYIKLIRPTHWVKNLFVFLPVFFGHQLTNVGALSGAFVAFVAFCLVASAVYCFNDIIDIDADRAHPVKCKRPIACGAVNVTTAYVFMVVLIALGVLTTMLLTGDRLYHTMLVVVGYVVMEFAYCTFLKRYAIVDVFILSMGFVLRILAGGAATDIVISHWLVMMTFLLTLFLGFAKRRDDVLRMSATGVAPRHNTKRYNLTFVNEALTITAAVMLVCYIMYTVSPEVTENFNTNYLYLTTVFVLAGLLRYIQLAVVDEKTGDPTKVLLKDFFTQAIIACWLLSFLLVIYVM